MSSFKISYLQKNFLHATAVLGYLPKLKRGLGLAFSCIFSAWIFCMNFPLKCCSFNTLPLYKIYMSYLFTFSRYQRKCVIKFLFRQLMTSPTFKIYPQSPSKAMAEREKKRRRKKYKNLNISRTEKAF